MNNLLTWDLKAFFYINNKWTNGFFDFLLPWLREPYIWAPLYLFLLVFVTYNFRWRGFFWIVFFIITFAITDQSSMFFKNLVGRLRPGNDPVIAPYVRVLVEYYPRSGSFTSSHAANHFGLAMFSFITLKPQIGKWAWLFFVWAAVICYSQVYVGVHYPLDIAGGALLGMLAGLLSGGFFQRRIRLELEQTT
ncbi:phosphatase PAP2 family protein [Chitinophaga sp. GCM10012297]|uniref:Phosphatase PAP2 family protein n=1 Tax=Chitinophaga chungangae TaxID=2821488 RepID=A0ABS3YA76_9BACT|nr:phosphatase PAP2 family protein [Chitinophaga chungangae]MBO9151044.1 phosphatase PAP2 family protein [Chitinophaga chungangae]